MAMIKWRPFSDIDEFIESLSTSRTIPAISELYTDVYEKNNNLIIELNAAGMNPEDIDITIEDNYLRVTGTREEEEVEEDKNYYLKEIRRGGFERIIDLPYQVAADEAQADFQDGMLIITIPKSSKQESRKLKVSKKDQKDKAKGQIKAQNKTQDKTQDKEQNKEQERKKQASSKKTQKSRK